MRWPWKRKNIREREPSPELTEARRETEEAKTKLQEVNRDDARVRRTTNRLRSQAVENNFAADIRRALGTGR